AFSFGRDGALPASNWISKVNSRFKTPVNALLAGAVISLAFVFLVYYSPSHNVHIWFVTYPANLNALFALVSFAVSGIYLSFFLTVIGAMVARGRGWVPEGAFQLGKWGWTVSIIAATYLGLMLINVIYPSGLSSGRELFNYDWITLGVMGVIALVGALFFLIARPDKNVQRHLHDAQEPTGAELPGTAPTTTCFLRGAVTGAPYICSCDRRPPGPRRVLRGRRGAREPGAPRTAARGGRRSARAPPPRHRQLRRAALRDPLGHELRRGDSPLPAGCLRLAAAFALPRVLAERLGDSARGRAESRADRDGRGLPRRGRGRAGLSCRSRRGRGGADRRTGRDEPHLCARRRPVQGGRQGRERRPEAGRPRRGPRGTGGRVPRSARGAAVAGG